MPDLQPYMPYMPYLVTALTGLVAGWLAGLLLGGGGLFRNLVVGILGAFIGNFIVQQQLLRLPYDFNTLIPTYGNQIAVATVGAVVVVIVARIIGR
jgi:uncharacterized membrane protein YeaQ/YmgE (transglycosylase-associated protein family)